MNDIALYLASKPEITEVILVLGPEADGSIIEQITSAASLESLAIFLQSVAPREKTSAKAAELNEERGTDFCRMVTADKLAAYRPQAANIALILDRPDMGKLQLPTCPLALLAGVLKYESSFSVWEQYRTNAQAIYLLKADNEEEILRWEKSSESNIELSVVFPVYNIADYLSQCIESVSAWKADYVEYLFVDDGSPDNSADIIREYAQKDSRIKLLQKKNGGCASARQYGLDRAGGRYVAFIDPDDFVDTTMLPKLFERAMEGGYEISYCGFNEYYNDTGVAKPMDDVLGPPYDKGTSDPAKINELIAYRRIAIWRGIYLRDLLVRNNIHFYEDIKRFDDLPFKVETFARARSVVSIPEYLYFYRMARPGQDVAADDERLYVHFDIFKKLDAFFKNSTDRRQVDYLQIVKIQTHHWALTKLKPQYIKPYCEQARKDLKSNMGFWAGFYTIKGGATRADLAYFTALYFGWTGLIRIFAGNHKN